ncbi:efflux RND transporter permease subunit, partial [bacterium]|nr:efflux RND transporter permease subunit [bacterium]
MNDREAVAHIKGPIAWMTQNTVAANLLMIVIIFGGIVGLFRTKQEVFPDTSLDTVVVSVPYPGASPSEVEQGIVLAIEEAVRGIDGVKHVKATAAEGVGTVNVELLLDADPEKALQDVKSEVDRIQSFPEQSEEPSVTLLSNRKPVVGLIVAGNQDLSRLHAIAEHARNMLLEDPRVTQVEMAGVPPLEISVEVSRENLLKYDLTLEEIARQLRASSLELPGGTLETAGGQILVRVADRRLYGHEFDDVIIKSTAQGAKVRLADIATIRDGFEDTDLASYFNGKRAVRVTAYRVGDETPTDVSDAVHDTVERLREEYPPNIIFDLWNDESEFLEARIDLLVRNARLGLILVVIILALFLELRLAFWVALGIPVSFLGAFLLMPILGISINMITLFGLIIVLGMVVDDAIVIGENIYTKTQQGMRRVPAAVEGATEMAVPVVFSVLTTVAAFMPMFFVPGTMGKIFALFPIVVISILFFSMTESFFVLPAHLSHGHPNKPGGVMAWIESKRLIFAAGLENFINNKYRHWLQRAIRRRYVAVAVWVALFFITIGAVGSGLVPFAFFPDVEGDLVIASARLPYGTAIERTYEVQEVLEASAEKTIADFKKANVRGMFSRVGESTPTWNVDPETGSHILSIEVLLVGSDQREFTAFDFADKWRDYTPPIAGVDSLTFASSAGPSAGPAVDVQLSHYDTKVLAHASQDVEQALRSYDQLTNFENTYSAGKPQLDFRLLPMARTLGLSADDIARQLRAAFYGAEAIREQRGRNELKVMVRLPEDERVSEFDIEQFRVTTPADGQVPLNYVAEFERGRAPTNIRREDGKRIIDVTAKLAPGVASSRPVLESISANDLPRILDKYPGLTAEYAGEQREQGDTFKSLGQNFFLALFVIFALLAIPLRSYVQPVIIMSAIPFSFVGAVFGHVLMGYNLNIISFFGIVALTGVVVNGSLVLVDTANRIRQDGSGAWEGIVEAGCRRFRPIMLTSLTTFFGLAPMIFETSVQARF